MADFPTTLNPQYGSRERWRDPVLLDYSRANTVHGRRLGTAKKRTIILKFNLTDAQRGTLETHYDGHRATTFKFTWPDSGVFYNNMLYADKEGLDFERGTFGRWRTTLTLEQQS